MEPFRSAFVVVDLEVGIMRVSSVCGGLQARGFLAGRPEKSSELKAAIEQMGEL